jgi:hypothetical protein
MSTDELNLYTVTQGAHTTVMQLNLTDAAAMGDSAVPVTVAPGAATVRMAQPAPAEPKSRVVTANKMRGTDDPTPAAGHH